MLSSNNKGRIKRNDKIAQEETPPKDPYSKSSFKIVIVDFLVSEDVT